MSLFQQASTLHITCAARNTTYLLSELSELGFSPIQIGRNFIQVNGTLTDCMLLNLHLRTAHRVLYFLFEAPIAGIADAYELLYHGYPWEEVFAPTDYFSVDATSDSHEVRNSMFLNLKIKDAIVDRIKEKKGQRPNTGSEKRGAVVSAFWREGSIAVYLDTSGDTIAKHGYRTIPFKAPLQEALAAAIIHATEWDRKQPFINPMCGSGTLAIEAALMAINKAPGLMRGHFAFMHIIGYQVADWHRMRSRAEQKVLLTLRRPLIIASDIDPQAIKAAKINVHKAGVEDLIRFQTCPFQDTFIPESQGGIVILNPEYGERLGDHDTSPELYAAIGTFFKKKCAGLTGFLFTGNTDLAKKIGLKPNRRIEFFNAKLDCRLYRYELFEGSKNNMLKKRTNPLQ